MLLIPKSSQKQTAAEVTDVMWKHRKASWYTGVQARCSLKGSGRGGCQTLTEAADIEISMQNSQQPHIPIQAQVMQQEVPKSKGGSAMTDVVEKVQLLHQGMPADQVRVGEVWKLRRLCGKMHAFDRSV